MHSHGIVFNVCFVALVLIFASAGALQCFWPDTHRALHERFLRGYNRDSPLGRMMGRARGRESSLLSRISGLFLFCMMIFIFGWWFLGHQPLGR